MIEICFHHISLATILLHHFFFVTWPNNPEQRFSTPLPLDWYFSSFSFRSFCIRRAVYNPLFILPQFYGIQETPPPTRRSPASFESDDDTPGKAAWCNNEYRRRDPPPLIFIYVARISDRQPPSRHLSSFLSSPPPPPPSPFPRRRPLSPEFQPLFADLAGPTMPVADCFVSDSSTLSSPSSFPHPCSLV